MGDPFGRWSNPPSRSEYDDRSLLRRSNSFARPSGKSIYNQRKDYGQILLKPQSDFQHHVEHLLTVRLERDIRSTDDCLARLKVLEAQGRVWGQDLILQVKDQELMLRDVESKEELEAYPLGSVQGCSAVLDICGYSSVLAISVQEQSPPGTSVLLFHCERLGADNLKSSLEKLVKQWKEEQRSQYGHRSSLDMPQSSPPLYAQGPYMAPEQWAEIPAPNFHASPQRGLPSSDYSLPDSQQMPQTNPPDQVMSNVDRDVEVLNHVLSDLELFVVRLKTALGLVSTTNTKKKKKMNKKALPSKDDYTDFFQKVKYALNLVGRTHQHVQEPDPSELLHLIFIALSFQVLDHCPSPSLAPAVEAPLLVPETVELLEKTLHQNNYSTWKSLGMAWNKSRAEYPNSELVPRYIPVFSDGWLPPPMKQSPVTSRRDNPGQVAPLPAQGLVRALYEFQGRNPRELSVRMGDTLQVLDQQKKWWLVQDSRGQKGYIPSNILEPLEHGHGGGHSASQDSPPNLRPSSSPAEVTAWLKDKGFSRITVRCLGVLTGHQLLHMSPTELQAVCPEEWRRVLFKLSSIKMSLGMGPRD
ncbi:PREDICTED: epidermal growth factor receptor kinase substrate 8-like protein 3 [Haliaeetus leucocephalus]|uniref:epidermal growth factor receptor kinase substrate 8-like protein 3 n=1 Tax=Haliaeetus leucocephalus TaxID=52644 RepID=UPI00053CAFA4|nr:PREDICTED: epidermal growth factor receptor kinase substrate 8-like protein 3 [Haliaeetus leucocephalus]